ncbi:MAG: Crp/Fnr family transcriptional regulator [Candidatus Rokuibacteriota bacterium]|nr:MAG: Crp/Fnr family transcriptional regulator [Candidatus Rokubacteria bacterium]
MTKVTSRIASDVATGLAAIPYLASLSARERADLAARCHVKLFSKRATVFTEGEPATGLWVVLAGSVRLVRMSARGREQVLHTESAGATLAEVPLFDGGGYVATAVAADEARLLFVPRQTLLALCRRHPSVALGVIAVLARRVRTFAALIEDLALRDVTARLARFILAEARRAGRDVVELTGTRDDVAARLGTVRELISRSLAQLRVAGAITVRGRRITVIDERRLIDLGARERA